MKILALLIILVASWYMAGMFYSIGLMVLCIIEFTSLVMVGVTLLFFKFNLKVYFSDKDIITNQYKNTPIKLRCVNRLMIPITRYLVRLKIKLGGMTKNASAELIGSADKGTSYQDFDIAFPICGYYECKLDKLVVYDYLQLNAEVVRYKKKSMDNRLMNIIVIPNEGFIQFTIDKNTTGLGGESEGILSSNSIGTGSEFNQVREYIDGDPLKDIHWKISAKSDKLYTKQYNKNLGKQLNIHINTIGINNLSYKEKSNYYILLAYTLKGLLYNFQSLLINNSDEVVNNEGIDSYISNLIKTTQNKDFDDSKTIGYNQTSNKIEINTKFELLYNSKLIKQFNGNNLDNELSEIVNIA